jgi:hypothetical protein
LPGRIVAQLFDGFRSLRRNGKFKTMGISWEELWDKYEGQIVQEECRQEIDSGDRTCRIDETALADRIYLRILERSCATNQAFDRLLKSSKKKSTTTGTVAGRASAIGSNGRSSGGSSSSRETSSDEPYGVAVPSLAAVSLQLENDVREILLNPKAAKRAIKFEEKEQKRRRESRKMQLLNARKVQRDLIEEQRQREEESSKWNKKRQRALQKALHKAAQRHRKQEQQQDVVVGGDDYHDTNDSKIGDVDSNSNNHNNNTTTTTIVEATTTFDTTKQVDRVRRAYPVLRIMARTRRHLES